MANTDLTLTTGIKVNPIMIKDITKTLSSTAKASSSIKKDACKILTSTAKINPIVGKSTNKKLTTTVKISAEKEINAASITMTYNGNAELGLGAEEGAQFNIIVTGTFTTFTISMNGKSLTYTENCIAQTITIDNVNATVKNGTTNKLSKVTGDVADFLKLIPGDNVIVYSKAGGKIDFKFDFRSQFI